MLNKNNNKQTSKQNKNLMSCHFSVEQLRHGVTLIHTHLHVVYIIVYALQMYHEILCGPIRTFNIHMYNVQ